MASISWETDGHGFEVCGTNGEEALNLFLHVREAINGYLPELSPAATHAEVTGDVPKETAEKWCPPLPPGHGSVSRETAEKWERIIEAAREEERTRCQEKWKAEREKADLHLKARIAVEQNRCEKIVLSGRDAPACAAAIRSGLTAEDAFRERSDPGTDPAQTRVRTVTPDELMQIAIDSGMPPARAQEFRDHLGKGGSRTVTLQGQKFNVHSPAVERAAAMSGMTCTYPPIPGEGGRPFISPDALKFGVRAGPTTSGRS